MLIIGTMYMFVCSDNYWKRVNINCLPVIMLLNASAYILEFSRKINIIKENICDGVGF